jgi:DNA-binding NarL/FixJ family response regulator
VRVLVVDDQRLVRDGIASVLALQEGIDVVGAASDGAGALAEVARLLPDVVLMDVRMPGTDGVTATAELRVAHPEIRVLMLTTFDDAEYVLAAVRTGACGYLLKDTPAGDLARAVRLAAAGIDQYDPAAVRRLAAALPGEPPAATPPLSAREVDVLRLLATGASNREIARRLYLSEGTVKNHVSSILTRLGLRDRTQAALHAQEQGWL